MKPTLTIQFEDGSSKEITLSPKVLVSSHSGLQAIEFRENRSGEWSLYFTERTMEGKKIESITFQKNK